MINTKNLLELIESNSKLTTSDIADSLGASELEVVNEISKLEKDKVICGYNAIINWDKITEEKVNALIEVKVTPQRGMGYDRLAERIAKFDEVNSIYLLSGSYDFMVIINGKSMKEISSFVFEKISTIDMIQSITTHFVLKKYKDHGVLMNEKKVDNRELISI